VVSHRGRVQRTELSRRLRDARLRRGVSLLTAAKAIGLSESHLCRWEGSGGGCWPRADLLAYAAAFYGVTMDWLMGRESACTTCMRVREALEER
jgi:transcriptional regulator with XRE-family HTH domain